MNRRQWLACSLAALATSNHSATAGIDHLPRAVTFKGSDRYAAIMARAVRENWAALPIGPRISRIGRAFLGIPYLGYTLEIHDRIECPSVNCSGLDCWTFFETVLGMARQLERPSPPTPDGLLREIQWTRYRAGRCTGNYLDRIHYLNEWFIDNEARGNVKDITRLLPGAQRLTGRESREMTVLWKTYRYLRNNPDLRPKMAAIEAEVSALPVWFIPKSKVAAIEPKLADGDIAGIVTRDQGGVCSHVGLITRDEKGRALFMHASRNFKKVTIENTISTYLNTYNSHAGLIIARPLPVKSEITSAAAYQRNLKALTST